MSARANSHLGKPHLHYRVCESTNDVAKQLAEHGSPHGTTVTADEQTSGRGRQGREWVAPPRSSLLMSAIARPVTESHKLAPLAAALAVAETCETLANVEARIKWPNDVWIEKRKVSGILVEARPDQVSERSWVIVGIGLNVAVRLEDMPAELQQTATTLGLPIGTDALTPLVARLDHWLASDSAAIVVAWRERDALRGHQISWADGTGTAEGVDDHGNLVIELADGELKTLTAGEVHLQVHH
ncbi:MAG: biotin--[acetyl-CoA-carboxylase] ligase [Solirubrobacterales bacterium]